MQPLYQILGELIFVFALSSTIYTFFKRDINDVYRFYFLFFLFFTFYGSFLLYPPLFFGDVSQIWGYFYVGAVFSVLLCAFSALYVTLKLTVRDKRILSAIVYSYLLYSFGVGILHIFYLEVPVYFADTGFVVWSKNNVLVLLIKIPLAIASIVMFSRFAISFFSIEGSWLKLKSILLSFAALSFLPATYYFFGSDEIGEAYIAASFTALGVILFFLGNIIGKLKRERLE